MSEENTSECKQFDHDTLQKFMKDGYQGFMESIKHSNSLPTGDERNFYNQFESFNKEIKHQSHAVLYNLNNILNLINMRSKMHNRPLENKSELLVDANDTIFEKVDIQIDEMNGIRKPEESPVVMSQTSSSSPSILNEPWNANRDSSALNQKMNTSGPSNSSLKKSRDFHQLNMENIARPQDFFEDIIDNSNDMPWVPRIKEKPNSLKPLAIFLEETEFGNAYGHPYEFELDKFEPREDHLIPSKLNISKPLALADTPLIEINHADQLPDFVNDLLKHKVIAVDVEHNSYRSFMGITCLLQISTNEKDYIVDTLKLRNDLWVLNEVFTKPDIVKVFHGAQHDVIWLQRDLSIYVVNMFDTYFAAKRLDYDRLSLAYLLHQFCQFVPDKQFQLADWRIRPLSNKMKHYARIDTHYLIYIYENMKRLLLKKSNGSDNLLRAVIRDSTELCKKTYIKPVYNEDSHLEFYRRCNRLFDNRQMYALKELYKWRDQISRKTDESTGYVLPNNMLLEIAEKLPREMQGILACCNPIPPLVRANLLELHKILLKALEKPYDEPILNQMTGERGAIKNVSKIDLNNLLYSPADMSKIPELQFDLPTLLGNKKEIEKPTKQVVCKESKLSKILNKTESKYSENLESFRKNVKFLSPFERYGLIRPVIQAREKKLAEMKENELEKEQLQAPNTVPEISKVDLRTDEERIESIRRHYVDLTQQAEELKNYLPPLEIAARKRKQNDVEPVIDLTDESPSTSIDNTTNIKDFEPISKKRKILENLDVKSDDKIQQAEIKSPKNNKNKNVKKKQIQNDASLKQKLKNRKRKPETTEFNPYDYSMVDFRQFEGGAKAPNKRSKFQIKNKIKGQKKGKKAKKIGRKIAI